MLSEREDGSEAVVNRSLTLGMVLIAFTIGGALLGFATAQTIFYVRQYWQKDRMFLKILVTSVWVLEIFHHGLFSASLYSTFVTFRFSEQIELPWTSSAQIIVNSTVTAVVQSFYVHRVWSFQKSVVLTTLLSLATIGCWSVGLAIMINGVVTGDPTAPGLSRALSSALSATTAGSDILLTASLSVLLMRSHTGSSRSKRLLNRLLLYTINTGALTSICSFLSLFTNIFAGQTDLYTLFYYGGTRLYTNSMMASLNARQSLRDHMANDTGMTSFENFEVHSESHQEPTLRVTDANPRKRSVQSLKALFRKTHGAHTPTETSISAGKARAFDLEDDAADATFPHPVRVPTQ
ncbi:hypothetical protein C8Q80DRAFT_1273555 [Daedaleopsis nitida]|nr:hypothetical protein C8Q80DRAFT_1273555 [Daedaleopsis nitida]